MKLRFSLTLFLFFSLSGFLKVFLLIFSFSFFRTPPPFKARKISTYFQPQKANACSLQAALLFIIYMNDVTQNIVCGILIFAGNTSLLDSGQLNRVAQPVTHPPWQNPMICKLPTINIYIYF